MNTTNVPGSTNRFKGLRWFIGIIAVTTVASAILTYAGFMLTREEFINPTLSKALDIIFREEGTAETTRVVNYAIELSKHQQELQSLSKLDPAKIQADLEKMSPEESQKYLETNLVQPMYENGNKIIEPLKAVDPNAKIEAERLDFISMANENSHQYLKKYLNYQLLIIAVLIIALVLLSSGWGRLSSVGFVIFFGSIPGFLLFGYFRDLMEKLISPALGDYINRPVYTQILEEIIYPTFQIVKNIYFIPVIIGIIFVVIALVLGRIFSKKQPPAEIPLQ